MTIDTTVLLYAVTIVVGIATWYIKGVDAKIIAAFKRIDRMRLWLLKNTNYTENDSDP